MSVVPNRARLSVVVPCFNEEAVLETTYERLLQTLEPTGLELELVFVDDGSQDRTEELLRSLQAKDERVNVLFLSRNFGHQIAVTAGTEAATGDGVVLIDADLQDPPEVIPQMIQLWRAGSDVVYGRRSEREGETAFKLFTASLFYRLINKLSETDIPLDTGDFRLMDRRVVDALNQLPEQDRFVRGLVSWVGFRQMAVTYKREKRFAGESKYPFKRMLRLASDAILSFSMQPLRLATWAGGAALLVALLGVVWIVVANLFGAATSSAAIGLVSAMSFLSGLQLISIGILGEFVGRTYRESKQRPLYLIRERLGQDRVPRVETISRAA